MLPVNAGAPINTIGDEMFPHLGTDGTLFFSSTGHHGMGGLDIFRAEKTADKDLGECRELEISN